MCLFSIITVCFNAENVIRETILSVLNQDYDDFEYIIQDGNSNDKTIEIAHSFERDFAERGISFKIYSQQDKGVYDAMNIAAEKAQGKWILYMNAGDRFADKTVLSKVSGNAKLEISDVIYGDVILQHCGLYKYKKAYDLEKMRFCLPFCHQSVFTRTVFLKESPFSLQYRICSDYLFFLQLYQKGKRFDYLPMAISIYEVEGISADYEASYKEKLRIHESMPVRDEEAIQLQKNWLDKNNKATFLHDHFWKFIPSGIRRLRRDYQRKKNGWKTEADYFAEAESGTENRELK